MTFYNPNKGFAGLTFLNLFPTKPDVLGAGDLMASSLMSAPLTPKQVRTMLAATSQIEAALSDSDLSAAVELGTAKLKELEAALRLHSIVHEALQTNEGRRTEARIKTDRVSPRKRPGLFPIRDRRVRSVVKSDAWLTFQHLLTDKAIVGALKSARTAATKRNPRVGELPMLRVMDTILWMA